MRDAIHAHGAQFFDELEARCRLLQPELEDALAELVARGQVTCDSFGGLRALLLPQAKRPPAGSRRLRRGQFSGIRDAGRWALARPASPADMQDGTDDAALEHVARVLLRRHGVAVARKLGQQVELLVPLAQQEADEARQRLLRDPRRLPQGWAPVPVPADLNPATSLA